MDKKLKDSELVAQTLKGNKDAFSTLIQRYQQELYALVIKIVGSQDKADDVMQEAFFKAYKKLHTFKGLSSFKSWLYRIAINTAKNALRGHPIETIEDKDFILKIESKAGENLEKQQIKKILKEEIEKLPKKQKLALTLRIYDGLSFEEIAKIMSCPYNTAKANFRHAILNLRKRLKNVEDIL